VLRNELFGRRLAATCPGLIRTVMPIGARRLGLLYVVRARRSASPTLVTVSRFVAHIRAAVRDGRLPRRFRPNDVRRACPGWADRTYSVFLPKHRRGNPGGYTEYFEQHKDGSFSLL
jgi:hypothetical protein